MTEIISIQKKMIINIKTLYKICNIKQSNNMCFLSFSKSYIAHLYFPYRKAKNYRQNQVQYYLEFFIKLMPENFIIEKADVPSNQSQMKKIQFLTRQKEKADGYIKDLEESLKLNKQALRVINNQGPKDRAINLLNQQNQLLLKRNKILFEQNRNMNSLLLFQSQIRLQQKSFFNQRVLEFENRIVDLRKYLHDKEDSFSNVVNRLRKYEELSQVMLGNRLKDFSNDLSENITHEMLSRLSIERNEYKKKCQELQPYVKKLEVLEQAFKNGMNYRRFTQFMEDKRQAQVKSEPELQADWSLSKKFDIEDTTKITKIVADTNRKFPVNPNKQLIKLLKKQKFSNEILEEALNDAIQKNEELVNYNDKLVKANSNLEGMCDQLRSHIMIIQGRLGDYDQNYNRKNNKITWKDDLDKPKFEPHPELRHNVSQKVHLNKIVNDVMKIAQFMAKSEKKMMIKSCSEPRLKIVDMSEDQLEIQEF